MKQREEGINKSVFKAELQEKENTTTKKLSASS